jgi:hypothetical protein
MLRDVQQRFRAAMTTSHDGALTADVTAPHGETSHRIAIYRETVQASLTDTLMTAFPVVARLVGATFFDRLAGAFIAARPPRVPQLSRYGEDFAEFIAAFEAAHELPYLADVARLEWARAESYFAEDAAPLEPESLRRLGAEDAGNLRLRLHPATRLVRSAFPIATIWTIHQPHKVIGPIDMTLPQNVVITRVGFEIAMRDISSGDATLVAALADGMSLGHAAEAALTAEPQFDLQAALAQHLTHAVFTA